MTPPSTLPPRKTTRRPPDPDLVARGRLLLEDPAYPSPEILAAVADRILSRNVISQPMSLSRHRP